jgi:uncharacterized protein YjbJ (UPF0337 family)
MNWDQVSSQFKRYSGQIKSRWSKLTDDDLQTVGGKKEVLVAKINQRYGIAKQEAERQLDNFLGTLGGPKQPTRHA